MNTAGRLSAGIIVVCVVALFVSKPAPLEYSPAVANPDLRTLVSDRETGLVEGTEKRLVWQTENERTEWSVVYLHGFSASRQEAAPLPELVANLLRANLFETRYSGHGLIENGLHDVTAERWLDDTAEALTVGQLIADKTVVIAVSTGATLALSLLGHPAMDALLGAYDLIDAPTKQLIPVAETGAPSAHMIVGDIITPQNTAPVADRIAEFILRRAP